MQQEVTKLWNILLDPSIIYLIEFHAFPSFRSTVRLQAHEAEHLAETDETTAIPTEEVESYLVISMEN